MQRYEMIRRSIFRPCRTYGAAYEKVLGTSAFSIAHPSHTETPANPLKGCRIHQSYVSSFIYCKPREPAEFDPTIHVSYQISEDKAYFNESASPASPRPLFQAKVVNKVRQWTLEAEVSWSE